MRFVDLVGRPHEDKVSAVARPRPVCPKRRATCGNDTGFAGVIGVTFVTGVRPGHGPWQSGFRAHNAGQAHHLLSSDIVHVLFDGLPTIC
jgi:hypothetical protein